MSYRLKNDKIIITDESGGVLEEFIASYSLLNKISDSNPKVTKVILNTQEDAKS